MKNIKKTDLQYEIRHHTTDKFKIGESVFLKSNPEWPMTVTHIGEKEVTTTWNNLYGTPQHASFPPQSILQYRYAGLILLRGTPISLN